MKFLVSAFLSLFLFCPATMAGSFMYGTNLDAQGLVASYSFEGHANDAGGNGLHGSAQNVTAAPGIKGSAFSFNGTNSLISIANHDSLNIGDAVTISLWFKPDKINDGWSAILSKGTNYYLGYTGGRFCITYNAGGWKNHYTANRYNDGEWYHLAAVIDCPNDAVQLYVTGSTQSIVNLAVNAQETADMVLNSDSLTIGTWTSQYAEGVIDEVNIFHAALTEDRIQALFDDKDSAAYTIVTTAVNGVIAIDPEKKTYSAGEKATLTAIANDGYVFDGWTGAFAGHENPFTLTIDQDIEIAAAFKEITKPGMVPVASYAFEGDAHDTSGNGLHGALQNVTEAPGIKGRAFSFNGTDSLIRIPNHNSLDMADVVTLSLWFKPDKITDGWSAILSKGTNYYLGYTEGRFCITYNAGGWKNHCTANRYNDGEWYHLAAVIDGPNDTVQLYVTRSTESMVNLAVNAQETADMVLNSDSLTIGTWTSQYAEGVIDEVKIFHAALTEERIQTLFDDKDATTYTLTVNAVNGVVAIEPDKEAYLAGEKVTLTANPNSGYGFDKWSGGFAGIDNPLTLTMDRHLTLTAHFFDESIPPNAPANLTVDAVSSATGKVKKLAILKWQDMSDNEAGFLVEKSQHPDFITVDEIPCVRNTTLFKDFAVDVNNIYYYRLLAYNAKGGSDYSNTGKCSFAPPDPGARLRFVGATDGSVYSMKPWGSCFTVLWFPNDKNIDVYLTKDQGPEELINPYIQGQNYKKDSHYFSAVGDYRLEIKDIQTKENHAIRFKIVPESDNKSTGVFVTNNGKNGVPVEINFESGQFTGRQKLPIFAIWVEDLDGKLIQNLYAASFPGANLVKCDQRKNRPTALPYWLHKAGKPSDQMGGFNTDPAGGIPADIDAVTGASRRHGFKVISKIDTELVTSNIVKVFFEIDQAYDWNTLFFTEQKEKEAFGDLNYYAHVGEPSLIYAVEVDLTKPGVYNLGGTALGVPPIGYSDWTGRGKEMHTDFIDSATGLEKITFAPLMTKSITVTVKN